jgi:hypothetical protein
VERERALRSDHLLTVSAAEDQLLRFHRLPAALAVARVPLRPHRAVYLRSRGENMYQAPPMSTPSLGTARAREYEGEQRTLEEEKDWLRRETRRRPTQLVGVLRVGVVAVDYNVGGEKIGCAL